jgi:hypothetical protein
LKNAAGIVPEIGFGLALRTETTCYEKNMDIPAIRSVDGLQGKR